MTVVTSTGAGHLPAPLTAFIGRRQEIAEISGRLGTARLLTLTGVGGVGKTRLALEAAYAVRGSFPDGVWLVDLAPVQDPSAVASAAATVLGLPDLGPRATVDSLAAFVAERRALIVLDNCEHLADACAELAHTLLLAAPGVHILATSRHTLDIYGEQILTVMPLPPDEAVELLRERAGAVHAVHRISHASPDTVARLCADLDGLPLAIELAASRLRTLTVEQVADRLGHRFEVLTSNNRMVPSRRRTLRAVIGWSYDLCGPVEQLLWNRVSVFAGSFALDAAEEVCAGDGIARAEVLNLLDRLVAQSVVLVEDYGDRPRYRLLETIRQYGQDRLADSGEERRLRLRHRDHFLSLAQRIDDGWFGPRQVEDLARLRAEHSNLLAALAHGDDPGTTLALAAALRVHWISSFPGEGRHQLERALSAAEEPTPVRANALWVAAWLAALQGDLAAADSRLAEAARLAEHLDLPAVRAHVHGIMALSAVFQGRLDESRALCETAVAAHTALGDESAAALALFHLTCLFSRSRDHGAVRTTGERALVIAEAHGERWVRAYVLWAMGHDAWARGDIEEAGTLIRTALECKRGMHDWSGTALMVEVLAWATAAAGDEQRAARLLGAAGALLRGAESTLATLDPQMAANHARCEETVLRALGPAAYQKGLAQGARLNTPVQAADYALGTGTVGPHEPAAPAPVRSPAVSTLTRREREVAALVAGGMSNRQIASALGLSSRTAEGHVQNILAKLEFSSRAKIATWWAADQAPVL